MVGRVTDHGARGRGGDPVVFPGASTRREGQPDRRDDERDDLYGQDSFPASDPPSTWWGESKDAGGTRGPVAGDDGDSNSLRRAAEELLRRGRAGIGMTQATARYRQFELPRRLPTT